MKQWIYLVAACAALPAALIAQSSATAKPASKAAASLEQRVKALEDREAILKTLYAYAYAIDFGHDVGEYTNLYTDDALFQSVAAPVPGRTWNLTPAGEEGSRTGRGAVLGREGLEKWIANEWQMREKLLASGHYRIHEVIEPDITIDGDRAYVHSYFQTTDNDNGRIFIVSIGVYKDELVRSPDGRWRIKERLLLRQGGNAPPASASKKAAE